MQKALGKTTIERDWLQKKLESLDLLNKRELVESKPKEISITRQCELLKINRTGTYYKPKPIDMNDIKIMNTIDEIYTDNCEYGYRQIHKQLTQEYRYKIGKDKVLKLMQIMSISAVYPHKKKVTTIKDKQHQVYEYLLKKYWIYNGETKSVYVPTVNEVWSGDITYIRTNGGFMYLAAIIDWHSKAILSYKISNSMDTSLVTDVLKDALSKYPKPKIFNSDQGSHVAKRNSARRSRGQYTSYEHTNILKENNIQISMNGKGRSIDNIIIERFFRTLKHSNIYISDYQSIQDLKKGVNDYIYKYNFKRFHSSIGYQRPMNVYLKLIENVA